MFLATMRGLQSRWRRSAPVAVAVVGATLALAAHATLAQAQASNIMQCRPSTAIAPWLSAQQERRVWHGLVTRGTLLVELWLSDSGTWTIVVVAPTGVSCVHLNGAAGEMLADVKT
ncbi:hypothetical protein CMI37_10045 [Candidatus Pacearchaeota archaeon]|nr:hypothetical protein [Candidatus Pacearchaeota archaeon]